MAKALRPVPNRVAFAYGAELRDGAQLHAELARTVEAQTEGLMLKALARPYVPNARTNVLKLKSEFIRGLGDSVTLTVVGARYARRIRCRASAGRRCRATCAPSTRGASSTSPSRTASTGASASGRRRR